MIRNGLAILLTALAVGVTPARGEEPDTHVGHSVWFADHGKGQLLIFGDSAERAYNDPKAEPAGEDDKTISKHFGPLDCKYIKDGIPQGLFAWLGSLLRGFDSADTHYVCMVNGLP